MIYDGYCQNPYILVKCITMRAIKINKVDNVAVVIANAKKGDVLEGFDITLLDDVPQGHKVALLPIKKGE
ncbi:MAG: hypothetical protein KBS81_08185, partial [Spirochaetales bacterium]|nr:hypothetical protein [Candidatus Physcosoma equi]